MKSKKIYILMGNPDKDGTVSDAAATTYAEAAMKAGHEVRRANISDLSFDPILHQGYKVIQDLEPDLKKVQEDIRWADHFVLIYPIWWSSTPALLKGLIDRLWLPAFAFHFWKNGMGWNRLMKGKTARVITLSKSNPLLIRFMFGDFTNEVENAVLRFSGFKVRMLQIGHSEKLTDVARARHLTRIAALARKAR